MKKFSLVIRVNNIAVKKENSKAVKYECDNPLCDKKVDFLIKRNGTRNISKSVITDIIEP